MTEILCQWHYNGTKYCVNFDATVAAYINRTTEGQEWGLGEPLGSNRSEKRKKKNH